MIKSNGGIIGPDNVTTGGAFGTASGVFKLSEVTNLIKESKWPTEGPPTTVANSVRFNRGSSDNLTLSGSSGGSTTKFTRSFWLKKSTLTVQQYLMDNSGTTQIFFKLNANDTVTLGIFNSGAYSTELVGNANLMRDPSAWYHIVIAVDYTNATQAYRARIYINNSEVTSFSTETRPNNTSTTFNTFNSSKTHYISGTSGGSHMFGGYLAEVVHIDGQQLAPTSFGEFNEDSGVWQPLESVADLTFGTNGFYLDFQDSSALGNDVSGNNNDYTANNLAAIDQSTDTCTNNFATINPLVKAASAIPLSEGNTVATFPSGWIGLPATFGMQSGKWYWEQKVLATNGGNINMGIVNENLDWDASDTMVATTGAFYYFCSGRKIINNSATEGFFASYTTNDIISIALDLDASTPTIIFYKNGTATPNSTPLELPANLNSSLFTFPYFIGNSSSAAANWSANFGNPSFSISSGNTDGNGYGNFEYAVPSGYLALCTKNLSEVLS